jgi:hypothetical protein
MIWGTINSAAAISVIGPQKGLLSKNELINKRKSLKGFEIGNI